MTTASVKEVARRAGVSVGTVSNVLNRPEIVAPPTRQRVLDAIAELGFVRNESARALRAGHSRTVGLVVLDVANPFFTDLARGAEAVADAYGAVVTLCNSAEDVSREARFLDHLEELRVQGILITPVGGANGRLEQLAARGIPVVLVDRRSNRRNCCWVAVDDVLGGRLAASHLLEQGHRRIAYVGGPMSIEQVADRYAGSSEAVADATAKGTPASITPIELPSLSVTSGRRAGQQLADLPASQRPTAVFCANDLLALGVLQETVRQGLRIPEDLAIVGYDDIEFAGAAAIPLSSVRQPREQLGRAAAELLLEEINDADRHRHRHVVFEPELVTRESSARRVA
jgi:DNA-binding LacI/PurR family transcriptional regulator